MEDKELINLIKIQLKELKSNIKELGKRGYNVQTTNHSTIGYRNYDKISYDHGDEVTLEIYITKTEMF